MGKMLDLLPIDIQKEIIKEVIEMLSYPDGAKKCSKCHANKPLVEFRKDIRSKDGLAYQCKTCRKKYDDASHERYKEQILKGEKERPRKKQSKPTNWWEKNKELVYIKRKIKYALNRESVKENVKKYKYPINSEKKNRKRVDELLPGYIVSTLKHTGLTNEHLIEYPQLIQLQKLQILNKRAIKKQTNDNKNQ